MQREVLKRPLRMESPRNILVAPCNSWGKPHQSREKAVKNGR